MKFLLPLFLLVASINSFAQQPFVLGQVEKINSEMLKETRTLNIYLPEGYSADSAKTYPVIYLLDGSANEDFIHIVGLVQYLTMIEIMPKSIVVGIANVDRKRDFTFPTTVKEDLKDFPTTGKSEKFISFIEKELQPFIQKKYKTNENKTIIGQSLGGLLATEILLKKPQLFTNYMIISPSLWWDNESLLTEAPKYLEKQTKPGLKVYLSVGAEGKVMEGDAKKLAEILNQKTNIKLDFLPLPDENHLTILHNSIYKGLGILYPKKK
ncbi:alpha/beta hydrolase [Pedobacter sp. CCM 8938]|uniref:Alpha/beta hydrolase n=2 Tax=Pedobacter fastidiosus TaxID=2765361 RepID=A0ABR7KMA2_9SPHI|nr:alpha/beta hydrolase [Pedobacter fastidiosus]